MTTGVERLDVLAWINLAARTATNFGLLVLVGHFAGSTAVEAWLVLITLVATLATLDALLSQYFVRAFIDHPASDRHRGPAALQDSTYWLLGLVFVGAGLLFIEGLSAPARVASSLLLGLLAAVRRLEARTRATADLTRLQMYEAAISLAVLVACLMAAAWFRDTAAVTLTLLATQVIGIVVKNRVLAANAGFLGLGYTSFPSREDLHMLARLGHAMLVSLGGALSANLGLLLMGKVLPAIAAAPLLLSYRLAMLACEFGSTPVVTRVPDYSRHFARRDGVRAVSSFRRDFRVSMFAIVGGLLGLAVAGQPLLAVFTASLQLLPIGALIALGITWSVERHNTLMSQFFMCAGVYAHYTLYIAYLGVFAVGVILAMLGSSISTFLAAHLLGNALIAPGLRRTYMHICANTVGVSAS